MTETAWARRLAWALLAALGTSPVWAQAPPDETTSGEVTSGRTCIVERGDTLAKIAKRLDLSVEQLKLANARTHDFVREGDVLAVSRAMPDIAVDRRALTLELRFEGRRVKRYPVAVGAGELTPTGTFVVGTKLKNPDWWHEGRRIPYGDPLNILGTRWMTLNRPAGERTSYGIHGTAEPDSIGKAASAGCIRMHNRDVEELFEWVPRGTLVRIVDVGEAPVRPPDAIAPAPVDAPKERTVHFWVRVLTAANTDEGGASLKRSIDVLRGRNVPNLATFPSATGAATLLYAGAFGADERDAAEQLAARVRAITVDDDQPFRDALVVTVAARIDTVAFIREEPFTVTGGSLPVGGARVGYVIRLRVDARLRARLDDLVDPAGQDMLDEVRALVRGMFESGLRRQRRMPALNDIARRLRAVLNALMDADVVEDVIFEDVRADL